MSVFKILNHSSPLCYLPSGKLICYKRGVIALLNDNKIEKTFTVFSCKKEIIIGRSKLLYRLFRMGIRAAGAIDEAHIVLSIKNMLYEFDLTTGKLSEGYFVGDGIRPLIFTTVNGINSFENGIYFGGYLENADKKPVNIYKREDGDKWKVVYTFGKGEINHIHNVVADPYRNCLWVFTGDFNEAAAIWKVTDNFKKVEKFFSNDQKYRGCVVFPVKEGLIYATDAPFEENYIYLLKDDLSFMPLLRINGSCIYGCKWRNKYVFSSTVEGDGRNMSKWNFLFSRKRGAGIKDKYVHMYFGNLKEGFKEIYKEKKDFLPLYTFQFGVFKFPYGDNNGDTLFFQPIATENDLALMGLRV